MDQYGSLIMIVAMVAILYFLMIRPENKRKKQAQEMRNSLKKGDVITSIGGIVGRIVFVTENTIVIETSEDRVRMELTKWAVSSVGVQSGDMPEVKKEKKDKKDDKDEKAEEKAIPAKAEKSAKEAKDAKDAKESAPAGEAPAEAEAEAAGENKE